MAPRGHQTLPPVPVPVLPSLPGQPARRTTVRRPNGLYHSDWDTFESERGFNYPFCQDNRHQSRLSWAIQGTQYPRPPVHMLLLQLPITCHPPTSHLRTAAPPSTASKLGTIHGPHSALRLGHPWVPISSSSLDHGLLRVRRQVKVLGT